MDMYSRNFPKNKYSELKAKVKSEISYHIIGLRPISRHFSIQSHGKYDPLLFQHCKTKSYDCQIHITVSGRLQSIHNVNGLYIKEYTMQVYIQVIQIFTVTYKMQEHDAHSKVLKLNRYSQVNLPLKSIESTISISVCHYVSNVIVINQYFPIVG